MTMMDEEDGSLIVVEMLLQVSAPVPCSSLDEGGEVLLHDDVPYGHAEVFLHTSVPWVLLLPSTQLLQGLHLQVTI